MTVVTRRFWCDAVLCGRRIFCEQFGDNVLARYGRRTQRLETIVHHLGLARGGRPAAAFAKRLMVPVSNDTLLRVVRRRIGDRNEDLNVIGIDDFAFRRGQTYGTIVCDLERRRPVPFCRIVRWIRLEHGSQSIHRYRLSPVIGAVAMLNS